MAFLARSLLKLFYYLNDQEKNLLSLHVLDTN